MKSKHTRGPWEVSGNDVVVSHVDECLVIARVEQQGDETSSNASLIAAAPDMYEALLTVVRRDGRTRAELESVAHAALDKADGR